MSVSVCMCVQVNDELLLLLYLVIIQYSIWLQKFDMSKKEYVFIDKYFGKQLTAEEFAQILIFFLYNGTCFRHDLLPGIIKMLQDLRESVKSLSSFRYFSSSLLLIYDGSECPEGLDEKACEQGRAVEDKLHEILTRAKFAEKNNKFEQHEATVKNGEVEGNGWSESSASTSSNDHLPGPDRSSVDSERIFKRNGDTQQSMEGQCAATSENHHDSRSLLSAEDLSKIRPSVDLRMIDFAHSTHSGFTNDPLTHKGPDDSYLTGLDSLISIFQNMYVQR